jgi:hypothetical protein
MLFVVDILRRGVLFPVDLLFFASRELTAIRGAVRLNLLVDAFLLIFQLVRLARRQLPALHTLSDALLLVLAALSNFVVAILRRVGVVLVLINLPGDAVLLRMDLRLLSRRQLSPMGRAVCSGFAIDRRFSPVSFRSGSRLCGTLGNTRAQEERCGRTTGREYGFVALEKPYATF